VVLSEESPVPGGIYISEIHYTGLFGNTGEWWVELYNNTGEAIDFSTSGLRLGVDGIADSWKFGTEIVFQTVTTIQASGFYIIGFGRPDVSDFNDISDIAAYIEQSVPSSFPQVTMYNADGTICDRVDFSSDDFSYLRQNSEYVDANDGLAKTKSIYLVDEANQNPSSNDRATRWALSGTDEIYSHSGRQFGSPCGPGNGD